MIDYELLLAEADRHPYPLLFATISGAHLYGFPSKDSDYDLRGVHILPASEAVGLLPKQDTIEFAGLRSGIDMDLVTHDVLKFFTLLLKRNGYVLEQLYSPLIVQTSPEHDELKAIAVGCVTRHHSHHYLGFAATQWGLFQKEEPPRVKPLLYVLRDIARELDVTWVVEGTVLQSGGRVRISVRLIEGATEKHLWAETYEKDMRDVLALQSEVAGDISREIRVKLTPPEKAKLAQSRTVNPEAYQDYLRGRYFWNRRTGEALKKAREYFEQAIEKDPSYAPAHSGLADAYALMGSSGYDVMPPREAMPRAKAAAGNALEIDDTLAEAHAALGYVKLAYDWDLAGAEQELARAIELKPNYAIAHQWQGELLMARSCPDEATNAFRRALELDPLSVPCNLGLGWSYYFCRTYDLAIEQFRRTLEIAPGVPMALYGLGLSHHHKNQHREGLSEFQKAYVSSGGEVAAVMFMGVTYALAGRKKAAEKELAKLAVLAKQSYVPAVYSAFIYVALNDLDRAFESLQKACEERSSYLIFLNVQPFFEKVREDPRYRDLSNRLKPA